MFLSKIQQSYCYIQLCKYRKAFVFESVSNELQFFLELQFKFH